MMSDLFNLSLISFTLSIILIRLPPRISSVDQSTPRENRSSAMFEDSILEILSIKGVTSAGSLIC